MDIFISVTIHAPNAATASIKSPAIPLQNDGSYIHERYMLFSKRNIALIESCNREYECRIEPQAS